MENMQDNVEEQFWEIVSAKIENHDQRIINVEQKVNAIPDNTPQLIEIKNKITELINMVSRITFPKKEIQDLSSNLNTSVGLLKQPVENNVKHHHYVSKGIIISACLFFLLCLVSMGWYITIGVLKKYKENDIKYRFLQVQTNKSLRQVLFITDSLYRVQSAFSDNVIHQEDSIFDRFKRLQEIETKEKEVQRLKKKLK